MHGVSQYHEFWKMAFVLHHELVSSTKANVATSTISSDDNLLFIDFVLVRILVNMQKSMHKVA